MAKGKKLGAIEVITKFFTLWVVVFAVVAILFPTTFKRLAPYIPYLLMAVMFGMGMTLTARDFGEVFRQPKGVGIGIVLQFVIMPLTGFLLANVFNLPPELAAGLVLVGSVPSGTASNVMSYIAKADVALSVTMTSVITLLAPFVTPYLYLWLGGKWIPINPVSMLWDMAKIVLIPIALGLIIRHSLGETRSKSISRVMPAVSVIAIVAIIAAVVAASKARLVTVGGLVLLAVVTHNLLGYLFGYLSSRYIFRLSEVQSRTVAIEVGMQNSGLAAALAMKFLTPVAALPGAVFSVWHNISGSILANYWGQRPTKDGSGKKFETAAAD